jgi:BMFP domain-containing protein YqiC
VIIFIATSSSPRLLRGVPNRTIRGLMPLGANQDIALSFATSGLRQGFCRFHAIPRLPKTGRFRAFFQVFQGLAHRFGALGEGPCVNRGQSEGGSTMDFRVDDLARRLFESMPPTVQNMRHDLEANFRAVLRANLARLDLLARDEFTAQTKVLERTRARLEDVEQRLAQLEARLAASARD